MTKWKGHVAASRTLLTQRLVRRCVPPAHVESAQHTTACSPSRVTRAKNRYVRATTCATHRTRSTRLIGQVVPKLWPFIYQTNDRTRCYDITIDVTILFFFTLFFFLHVQPRKSEGTACVVVVSGKRFETFFFFLHVRPCTYGHACTGTRERKKCRCGCCFGHAV